MYEYVFLLICLVCGNFIMIDLYIIYSRYIFNWFGGLLLKDDCYPI